MMFKKFFKKLFKPKQAERYTYIERDTKCDLCDRLEECRDKGCVVDVTRFADTRTHYVIGLGKECLNDKELY